MSNAFCGAFELPDYTRRDVFVIVCKDTRGIFIESWTYVALKGIAMCFQAARFTCLLYKLREVPRDSTFGTTCVITPVSCYMPFEQQRRFNEGDHPLMFSPPWAIGCAKLYLQFLRKLWYIHSGVFLC